MWRHCSGILKGKFVCLRLFRYLAATKESPIIVIFCRYVSNHVCIRLVTYWTLTWSKALKQLQITLHTCLRMLVQACLRGERGCLLCSHFGEPSLPQSCPRTGHFLPLFVVHLSRSSRTEHCPGYGGRRRIVRCNSMASRRPSRPART